MSDIDWEEKITDGKEPAPPAAWLFK